MWIGFNAQYYIDHLPKLVVIYMPNIDCSPTNDDVIVETLLVTKSCAQECEQLCGLMSYDLDIAKRAIKIQVAKHTEIR